MSSRTPRLILLLAGVLAAAALFAACGDDDESGGGGQSGQQEVRKAKIMLEFPPNASQIWFFSGLDRGTFKKAGLDVEFLIPDQASTPIKAVTTKNADFGLTLSTDSITAYGQDAPVRVVMTLEPRILEGMAVLPENIKSFEEIRGKTVGLLPLTYEEGCFDRQLKEHGMTKDDVKIVDPGFNLVPPLVNGKLDMVTASSNYEGVIAKESSGKDLKIFQFSDVCPNTTIHMVTSKQTEAEDPEFVKTFEKAALDSLAWAMANPEEAHAIYAKRFPELDEKVDLAQWKASVPTFCAEYSEEHGLGYSDPEQWTELIELTKDQGAIDETFPLEDLVTNDHVPDPPMTEPCAGEKYKEAKP